MAYDSMELLFFDTFSHENSDEDNLDLVQFPRAICINEVRVIPLGTRVQADFPGGVRLGATNPSEFHIDFFVSDLSKTGASTFQQLGSLDYKHNVEIQLTLSNKIPTDLLVVQGCYTAVTLAIYGNLTKVIKERAATTPPPPPPPPPPLSSAATTPLKTKSSSVTLADSETRAEDSISEAWQRDVSDDAIAPHSINSKPCKSPEQIQQFPIPTHHTQSKDYDARWPDTTVQPCADNASNRNSHEYGSGSQASLDNAHRRREEKMSAKRDTREDRREPRGTNVIREHDKNERDRGEKGDWERDKDKDRGRDRDRIVDERDRSRDAWERERDRDGRGNWPSRDRQDGNSSSTGQREFRGIRTPPGTPGRRHPSSPKERRPRTPTSPHPSEIKSPKEKPASPLRVGEPPVISSTEDSQSAVNQEELFEPLTPEASLADQLEMLSDGDVHDSGYPDFYEEIVSDEEEMFESEERLMDGEMEYDLGDDAYFTTFNPLHCEFTPLMHFPNPSFTSFEIEVHKSSNTCTETEKSDSFKKFESLLQQGRENKHQEKWIEVLEALPNYLVFVASDLVTDDNSDGILDLLVDWCSDALDFQLALQQPQAVYKVRHMKAGIKLATGLFNCHRGLIKKLIKKSIDKKLLKLYSQEYMSLSLKLLILRALDAATRTKEGMRAFLGSSETNNTSACQRDERADDVDERTCYQMLLEILLSKQMTRATVALTALLRKIHFYEVLENLYSIAERVSKKFPSFTPVTKSSEQEFSEVQSELQVTNIDSEDFDGVNFSLKHWTDANQEDLKAILLCLQEAHFVLSTAEQTMTQPWRSLPVKAQFEVPKSLTNPYTNLYSICHDCYFLEILLLLLAFPGSSAQPAIVNVIKDIFSDLITSQHGMLFLLSRPNVCNAIVRFLLQGLEDGREDIYDDPALQQLGQQMVHLLHAMQFVDALMAEMNNRSNSAKEIDDPEILSTLNALYTMTFTPQGRLAVVSVLAMEHNLVAILPFVQLIGEEEYDLKLRKSACIGYATELLLMTVRLSENVELLENFSEKLLDICNQEMTPKLLELGPWLACTRKLPNYSIQAVPVLCGLVKANADDVLSFPGELITSLRLLHHLCVPPRSSNENSPEELKFKYVAVQLYTNDILSCFFSILQKICDSHQYPSLHTSSLVGNRGTLLVAVIKPIISMILQIMSYLINCRNNEFKDLTSVPTFVFLYSLLSSFPASSAQFSPIQKIQSDIIDTLLVFTQPVLGGAESEETLSGSLWTRMLQEIFKVTLKTPDTFISGFTILSELLPLPLPIHSQEPLSSEEVTKIINYRKLWSAHLHCLSPVIQDVIMMLGSCSDPVLQQLVRRVCIQIADLSAPTALVVVRGLLDAILDGLNDEVTKDTSQLNHLTRLLNLLSFSVSHACIKIPLLHLMRGKNKIDKKYVELLPKMASILSSLQPQLPSDKISGSQQIQECIMSIFQSLCDNEISLSTPENQTTQLEQLANCLPSKEHLGIICSSLWEHLSNGCPGIPSVLIALRTLVMLTEQDYGFYHLKINLDKLPATLHLFLVAICDNFVRDNPDFISCLSTFLELLQLMMNSDDEVSQSFPRCLEVTPLELAHLLKWEKPTTSVQPSNSEPSEVKTENEEVQNNLKTTADGEVVSSDLHPLLRLKSLLEEANREEEGLEVQALENVQNLIQLLNEAVSQQSTEKERAPMQEIILPEVDKLSQQFNLRVPYLVGDIDEDGLSPAFWLSQQSSGEDSDQENDTVTCDLQALADQICLGLDFAAELGKMFLVKDETEDKNKNSSGGLGKRKYPPLINPGQKEQPRKKTFIAPMRGRGYSRGMLHSSRANDPFRSRPPNTSRPPSMHVDDFLALESFQPAASSSGSQVKRSNKETNRGRGRGFEGNREFSSSRGRFFPTGSNNYARRDERGRAGSRGIARPPSGSWGVRGIEVVSPTSKSQQKFTPGSPRPYVRGSHVEPRSERSEPRPQPSTRANDPPSSSRFTWINRNLVASTSNAALRSSTRAKERDTRFLLPTHQTRGRRDANRHPRAFTR